MKDLDVWRHWVMRRHSETVPQGWPQLLHGAEVNLWIGQTGQLTLCGDQEVRVVAET